MSWLGGSLSSLTGQLTTLTKDILTEGTEEVSDHATELKIAHDKIAEYEATIQGQKAEGERLKRIIHELEEKAESSELQINSISREYRTLLEEKEKENHRLKHELEQSISSPHVDTSHHSSTQRHAGPFQNHTVHDELDFGDNIGMQHEINRLTQEAQHLRSEVKRWKNAAQQASSKQGTGTAGSTNGQDLADLKNKIKELTQQLRKEKEEHQQEVVSLQDVHAHKISTLRSKFQNELDIQREIIEELKEQNQHGQQPNDSSSRQEPGLAETQVIKEEQLEELQREVKSLKEERLDLLDQVKNLQSSQSGDGDQREIIHELEIKLEERDTELRQLRTEFEEAQSLELLGDLSQVRRVIDQEAARFRDRSAKEKMTLVNDLEVNIGKQTKLLQQVQDLQKEKDAVAMEADSMVKSLGDPEQQKITADILNSLEEENLLLKQRNTELQEQTALLQKALQTATESRQRKLSATESQQPSSEADTENGGLTTVSMEDNNSRETELSRQLAQYEAEMESSRKLQQSLEEEKTALEQCVVDLRSKLKSLEQEKEDSMREIKILKDEYATEKEQHDQKVLEMEEKLQEADNKVSEIFVEKESLEDHIQQLEEELKQVKSATTAAADQAANQNEDLISDLEEKKKVINSLQKEKESLHQSVVTLEQDLQTKDRDLAQYTSLQQEYNNSRQQLHDLQSELSQKTDQMQRLAEDKEAWESSLQEYTAMKTQMEEKEQQLMELTTEKAELEAGLEELDSQHQEAMAQVIQIRNHLQSQLNTVKGQLAESQAEVMQLRKEQSSVQTKLDSQQNSENQGTGSLEELGKVKAQLKAKEEMVAGLKKTLQEMKTQIKKDDTDSQEETRSLRREVESQRDQIGSLEEQMEEMGWQCEEKDAKIESLKQQLASLQDWGSGDAGDDQEAAELREEIASLKTELDQSRSESNLLKEEVAALQSRLDVKDTSAKDITCQSCVQKDRELQEAGQKLEAGAMALNNMHMDTKEMQTALAESQKSVEDKVSKVKALREENSRLQTEMRMVQEELEGVRREQDVLQNQSKSRDTEVEREENYKELLSESERKREKVEEKLKCLSQKCADLEGENNQIVKSCKDLEVKLAESSQQIAALQEELRHSQNQMQERVAAMTSEKDLLEKEFVQSQYQLQAQIKSQEDFISALKQERESDASALEQQYQNALQEGHEKDLEITRLRTQVQQLTEDIQDIKGLYEAVQEARAELERTSQNTVTEALEAKTELERLLQEKDVELKEVRIDFERLRQEKDTENKVLKESSEEEAQKYMLKEKELEAIQSEKEKLSREFSSVCQKLEEQEVLVQNHETIVSELQQCELEMAAMMEKNDQLQETINSLTSQLEDMRLKLKVEQEKAENVGSEQEVCEEAIEKSTNSQSYGQLSPPTRDVNKTKEDNDSEDWEEEEDRNRGNVIERIESLQEVIKQKDQIIQELQTNNASLLKVMEGSSSGASVLEVQRLEKEVKEIKMEKEQIVAVMTEKSRENSNLKSEVFRLMNVISAEKGAIEKLQADNRELQQTKRAEGLDDMQKEAMKNLSRLVRDKDVEIEALTQKNQTLLQVLQESSPGGAEVSSLMQDKDNLSKQLAALQSEREQMLVYLNQKHQESVAYHNEIQRLNTFIKGEAENHAAMERDLEALRPQYEDNKQQLMKAQHELLNYKQKYTELEVKHGQLLQRSSDTDVIDRATYDQTAAELGKLQEKHKETLESIQEKEDRLVSMRQLSFDHEEAMTSKEQEITALKKQVDNMVFQVQDLQSKLDDTTEQTTALEKQCCDQNNERQMLKDNNAQLTLQLQQKEFELKSAQEKAQTLSALVQDQQQGSEQEAQVKRLMGENEAILTQARQIQQERDQALMVVRQQQEHMAQLSREIASLKDYQRKSQKEVERLRNHLISIEDGYTKEALEAEEREKDLRTRLLAAEEKVIASTSAVQNASETASARVESLQHQLSVMATQRDQAYLQVSSLQDQNQQYACSLANLQMVLEQFQTEKDNMVASEVEKYQRENINLKKAYEEMKSSVEDLKHQLQDAEEGLEAAARLSEQLDKKEEAFRALKEEVFVREQALKTAEEEIYKLTNIRESKVDKIIIKNLLLGYFTTPKGQQQEALRAVGGVLGFTPDDYLKINNAGKSWVSGIFGMGGNRGSGSAASTPPSTPTRRQTYSHPPTTTPKGDKSFSELFVSFLEKESTPPPSTLRLPAEEMAADVQKHKDKPAYNPFTAPRHVAMPLTMGSDWDRGHGSAILMSSGQMSPPALSLFTPASLASSTGTSNSSSSAILKDVLASS